MNINLTCPINSLGYGVVGLNLALALERAGHKTAWWPIGPSGGPSQHQEVFGRMRGRTESYDKTAPSLRVYHQFDLAQHVGKGLHIGFPIFELNLFTTAERNHLLSQDKVIVPSSWAKGILQESGVLAERIAVANFGVDQSIFSQESPNPEEYREEYHSTIFLNAGKWEVRKGHDLLIEAFEAAFTESDNVELWMLSQNPVAPNAKKYNEEWNELYKSSKLGKKVHLWGRVNEQKDVANLMRIADCGVFPSRAEGWGLESAEMLAMGKHVILTNYSAHTEYATSENSLLIDVDSLEDAHDGVWFDAGHARWSGKPGQWAHLGQKQFDQLVEHMRDVHKRKQEGNLSTNQAGIDSFAKRTWDATALAVTEALS